MDDFSILRNTEEDDNVPLLIPTVLALVTATHAWAQGAKGVWVSDSHVLGHTERRWELVVGVDWGKGLRGVRGCDVLLFFSYVFHY